jgi:hypothetical protein
MNPQDKHQADLRRRIGLVEAELRDDELWAKLDKSWLRERLAREDRIFHGQRVEARLAHNTNSGVHK